MELSLFCALCIYVAIFYAECTQGAHGQKQKVPQKPHTHHGAQVNKSKPVARSRSAQLHFSFMTNEIDNQLLYQKLYFNVSAEGHHHSNKDSRKPVEVYIFSTNSSVVTKTMDDPTSFSTFALNGEEHTTKGSLPDMLNTSVKLNRTKSAQLEFTEDDFTLNEDMEFDDKTLQKKELERDKEFAKESVFARVLRYLYEQKTRQTHYGFTASVRVGRTPIANGFVINMQSVLTVIPNYSDIDDDALSVRVGRGLESQVLEVGSVRLFRRKYVKPNKAVLALLMITGLFEFGKTVYPAKMTDKLRLLSTAILSEWKNAATAQPAERLDIPLTLVSSNVSVSKSNNCQSLYGNIFRKSYTFCVKRNILENHKDTCSQFLGSPLALQSQRNVFGILIAAECNAKYLGFLNMQKIRPWLTKYTRHLINFIK